MRLIDADEVRKHAIETYQANGVELEPIMMVPLDAINNAPTISPNEPDEKEFITECRNRAIEMGLPLYFIYNEETGVCEIYITETRELFEKRHCTKHLSSYEFQEIATRYLDEYSNWKGGAE